MLWLFKRAAERLKALLVADAALELEAEFLSRQAERRAALLRQAHEHEEQGHAELAEELRLQAAKLSVEKPLASVLPVLRDLGGDRDEAEAPGLTGSHDARPALVTANGSAGKPAKSRTARKAR